MTYEEAISLCRRSKRLTEQQADKINRLANSLIYGRKRTDEDKEKGVSLYLAAAEAHDNYAEYNLGYYYYNVKQDYQRAFEWHKRAAEHGNEWSMGTISYDYLNGDGVEVDEGKSIYWLKKGAQKGDSYCQFILYKRYYDGVGLRKNRRTAMRWLRLAAENGDADAQHELSWHYRRGDGVEQSYEQEVYWLRKALENGDDWSINDLGWNYLKGLGVEKDAEKAVTLFRKAARKKDEHAAYNLALCYRDGEGVEKNLNESIRWLRLAKRWSIDLDPIEIQQEIDDLKQILKEIPSQKELHFVIREMKQDEYPLLQDFLYQAIFQPDKSNLAPKSIIEKPELQVYIKDFGTKKEDYCLCAEVEGKVAGAVWVRNINGYGSVDDDTVEFSISVFDEYQNKGIGTELMERMIEYLKEQHYPKASLAVQKANYAVHMYQKMGFEIVDENEQEYIMVHYLGNIFDKGRDRQITDTDYI